MTVKKQTSVYRQITRLSLPILLGMAAELLYTLADMYFITQIDKSSTANVSGVGIVFPLIFLLTSIDQGICSGISTITAISCGANDHQTVKKAANTGFNLSLYAGLVLVMLFLGFTRPIISFLSGSNVSLQAQEVAVTYLRYCLPGFIFMFLVQARFSTLEGLGKTKVIGAAMAGSTVLNIILDPIFIFGLNLGVKGAALATVISQFILFIFVTFQFRKTEIAESSIASYFKFDRQVLKRIIKIGIPSSLSFVILSASYMVLNKAVSNISEMSLNAYTLVTRLDSILVTPALAFSIGLSIIIGQNYGAGNDKQLKDIFRKGVKLITAITVALGIFYMVLAKQIFTGMSANPEVISLATRQAWLLTVPVAVGMSITIAASSCLRALELATKSMLVTGFRALFITAPILLIVPYYLGNSIYGVWAAIVAGLVGGSVIGLIWVNRALPKTKPKLKT